MQRVDALVIFAKVGELGSISGAARALKLPKANVSRAVARLESEYGVALIERTTRRVILTEIGQRIHGHCIRIMDDLRDVDAEAAAHRGEPSGILRVGCPTSVARPMTHWLSAFFDRYPEIDLRLKVADRLLPAADGHDVVLHVGWLADSTLIARKLMPVPLVLVASRGYVRDRGAPASPDELREHAVLGHYYAEPDGTASPGNALPAMVRPLQIARGGERYPVSTWQRFATNDPAAMLAAARSGMAIALTGLTEVADEVAAGDLVRILPDYDVADAPSLYAVYASRSPPPKVRAFLDFLVERTRAMTRDH